MKYTTPLYHQPSWENSNIDFLKAHKALIFMKALLIYVWRIEKLQWSNWKEKSMYILLHQLNTGFLKSVNYLLSICPLINNQQDPFNYTGKKQRTNIDLYSHLSTFNIAEATSASHDQFLMKTQNFWSQKSPPSPVDDQLQHSYLMKA